MAKKVGRPKMKLSDLSETWKEDIINLASEGGSIVEIAVMLDISRMTIARLCNDEPEFLDTIKKCKRVCQNWWERKGRMNLENKDFSYTGWYMNMRNRFGWSDKTETKQDVRVSSSEKFSISFGED